ncbi:MAG: glycosyltransferase [Cyclobacteriaceae bacterium]
MKQDSLRIAFYASSLVSAYWNGAATYYRGIVRSLHRLGHRVTFFEPDAYQRQQHRDMDDPDWAEVVVYPASREGLDKALSRTPEFDVVVKASGVGVFDAELEREVIERRTENQLVIFWDVDAPATLHSMDVNQENPFRQLVPEYDLILTYGGGEPVVQAYHAYQARKCVPIYNALDPDTHHPVPPTDKFKADLSFMGNRLPDREKRVEEFFLRAASLMPEKRFLLGGSGWQDKNMPANVDYIGHVYTREHNTFCVSPRAVLNISRESMAKTGFSPATRVFEAAGAGACLITDYWEGIELFLEPDKEVLVAQTGEEVAQIVANLSPERAQQIGENALQRVLSEHTYQHRAGQLTELLTNTLNHQRKLSYERG